jgi:hypothetical protein
MAENRKIENLFAIRIIKFLDDYLGSFEPVQ